MKHKLYTRFLSLALALALVGGMLPGMTFAGAVDTTALQSQVEQIAEPTEEPETVSEESSQAEATPTPAPESSQVEETPAPTEEPEDTEDTESTFIPPMNVTNAAPLTATSSALPTMNRKNLLSVGKEKDVTPDNGLDLVKVVEGDRKNGYKVKLEVSTTGTVTGGDPIPADIVLVLDVSGSMKEEMVSYGYNVVQYPSTRSTYYVKDGESYKTVSYCSNRWHSGRNCYHHWVDSTHSQYWNGQFYDDATKYERVVVSRVSRMEALRTAVDAFLDSVQESAKGKDGVLGTRDDVHHRVSFVKFAGNNSESIGNDTYPDGWYTYNRSQQVTELLDMTDLNSATTIMSELNDIDPAGATSADYGMNHAADILDEARTAGGTDYNRGQVAILFTDGDPNHGNGFDPDVANDTISEASRIKNAGGTVYSIGIFSGADGTVPENADGLQNLSDPNCYMHLLSSNFPDATGWEHRNWQGDQWGELNPNLEEGESYYLSADNTDGLTDIFENISDEISSPSISLDETTKIRDVVTDYFDLSAEANVKVEKWDKRTAGEDQDAEWTRDEGWELDPENITVANDAVEVTGINLSQYFILDEPRENPDDPNDTNYYGSKFVITFPITVKQDFFGGNGVPTNEVTDSGVFKGDGTTVENFPDPGTQDIALKYQFDVQDQTIYVSESADLSELIEYVEDYVPGTILLGADTEKNNDYVDLVFTVRDAAGNVVGTYTVAGKSNEGSWTWADGYTGDYAKFKDCTDFTISCTVQPKPEGSIGPMDVSSVNNPATVHVLKPTITWKDSTQNSGTQITDELLKSHQVDTVTWGDENNDGAGTLVTQEPTLTYEFSTATGEQISGPINAELHVKVDVKVGETPITDETTFNWEKDAECPDSCTNPNPSYQFRIHVGNGDLTIVKKISDGAGSYDNAVFDFKIVDEDGMTYYIHLDASSGRAEDTINLPSGTYTVTELDNLNYTPEGAKVQEVTVGGDDVTVTFTNNSTPTKIPSDSGATQNNPDDDWNGNSIVAWKPDETIVDGDVQTDETSN